MDVREVLHARGLVLDTELAVGSSSPGFWLGSVLHTEAHVTRWRGDLFAARQRGFVGAELASSVASCLGARRAAWLGTELAAWSGGGSGDRAEMVVTLYL